MEDAAEDPLPTAKIALLLAVTLNEALANTVLFPFVPDMVRRFGYAEEDVGYYAGMVASAYNLAQLPAGITWGALSDRVGRAPLLAVGVVTLSLSMAALGFSHSLAAALAARTAGGLLSGNSGIARAAMRDITTPSNRSRAFSKIGLSYGFGFLVGPLLGGALSRPADSFPSLRGTLLDDNPYLLPCLVTTIPGIASLVLLRRIPLTPAPAPQHVSAPCAVVSSTELSSSNSTTGLSSPRPAATASTSADEDAYDHLESARVASSERGASDAATATAVRSGAGATSIWARVWPCSSRRRSATLLGGVGGDGEQRARLRVVYLIIFVTFVMNFVVTAMAELFPLLAAAEPPSGLGLAPRDIASALAPLGVSLLIMPFIYTTLDQRLGAVGVFRIGCVIFLVVNASMPFLTSLRSDSLLWASLVLIALLRGVGGMTTFASLSIMLNAAITERIGFYNGLSSSAQALGRALSPVTCGALFAVSRHMHARFNVLPFAVIAALSLSSFCVSLVVRIPRRKRPGGALKPAATPAAAAPPSTASALHCKYVSSSRCGSK